MNSTLVRALAASVVAIAAAFAGASDAHASSTSGDVRTMAMQQAVGRNVVLRRLGETMAKTGSQYNYKYLRSPRVVPLPRFVPRSQRGDRLTRAVQHTLSSPRASASAGTRKR